MPGSGVWRPLGGPRRVWVRRPVGGSDHVKSEELLVVRRCAVKLDAFGGCRGWLWGAKASEEKMNCFDFVIGVANFFFSGDVLGHCPTVISSITASLSMGMEVATAPGSGDHLEVPTTPGSRVWSPLGGPGRARVRRPVGVFARAWSK
eukprot:CAMPEP_0171594532 /NCGR_PEP_ID=MMETSP0990-20121206/745_1 /TAXON_ID=483369 /ORGANISM="non described non described, Strain CCMP2098" /LENGTH=147 /DNA_ID=CAMNT_0012155239 /DNA_START=134 /DNA_END=577 /DNA_ORIENTATION=+